MTIPAPDAPSYTDLAGLTSLKRGAASNDPAAIREVARQFESMFTRMMLKSMRDAVGKDPIFGSDQEQMYQGMADDQMSIQLSRGKGLGLADMLVRQLQKMGVAGAGADTKTPSQDAKITQAGRFGGTGAYSATQRAGAAQSAVSPSPVGSSPAGSGSAAPGPGGPGPAASTFAASTEEQTKFVHDLWPQAQLAGQQLGVDPRNLIAQAALETHWGRNLPRDASGQSSNNLFGIKASADWTGATVTTDTQEYQGGAAGTTSAQFRAYAAPAQSFQDYVAVLRGNPRYATALNTGSDVQAFATGLKRGGYATDPDYVNKISAIAHTMTATAPGATDLKFASALPITAGTGRAQEAVTDE